MAKTPLSAAALEGQSIRETSLSPKPDLASLPPTFILATNLSESELHKVEDTLVQRGAPITYDIKEANLVIGNISKGRRAKFELKRGNVPLEDYKESPESVMPGSSDQVSSPVVVKRRKLKDGTPGSIEAADTENACKTEPATTDIYSSECSHASRSISQLSLVNISFIYRLMLRI